MKSQQRHPYYAGLVTTTRVTHATPGALYAHSYARDFETDADLAEADTPEGVHDIAWQLVNQGCN